MPIPIDVSNHWSNGLFTEPLLEVIEGFDDENLSYEFSVTDFVLTVHGWYIVSTAGCSCPTYDENAGIDLGPYATPQEALGEWLEEHGSNDAQSLYYTNPRESLVAAVKQYRENN